MALAIVLHGADGRMGRAVSALAACDPRVCLSGSITRATAPEEARRLVAGAQVLIDFSAPSAALALARLAARARTPLLVGTTGFSPAQMGRLHALSRRTALLLAPNTSPGMNVLAHLARAARKALASFDAAISETHHAKKKDSPSGSAKLLAAALAAGAPGSKPVPIVSLRAGDVVGDHTVLLAGPGERLEFTHRAHTRDVFARGALDAALWLSGRRPGWYSMADVLGLGR